MINVIELEKSIERFLNEAQDELGEKWSEAKRSPASSRAQEVRE